MGNQRLTYFIIYKDYIIGIILPQEVKGYLLYYEGTLPVMIDSPLSSQPWKVKLFGDQVCDYPKP